MGNFTRRAIAFILGMVVGIVTLFGGIAGAMYWAFKNLSLSKVGAMQEDESGLGDATIEDLVALIMMAQSDPESFTIKKLEEQGIDLLKLLGTLGVDFSKADEIDYNTIKEISPLLLFSKNGLNEISFSTIFALLPKGEDGTYPVFSAGARNMLRGYSLGYLIATDETTGKMRLFSEISGLKIGSIFPKTFTEAYSEENCEYTYTAENPALEKLGNLKVSLITSNVSGESAFNLGYELNEGELKEIGDSNLADFLADLIAGKDESSREETRQGLSLFDGILVKELFKFNEDGENYEFNVQVLFSGFSIGKFMGYTQCVESESCPIHENVANCDGKWYQKCSNSESCPIHSDGNCEGQEQYKKLSGDTAGDLITNNLINLSMEDMLDGGIDVSSFVKDVYLGHSLGYKMASSENVAIPNGFCDKECDLTEDHTHTYYWINEAGEYVGTLYNDISNMALEDALNGEGLDLEGVVETSYLGDLLGKYNKDGVWYDDSDCTIPTKSETAMEKILLAIYDKNMQDFSNGNLALDELLDGIKLGELMGYAIGEKEGCCQADCLEDHDHEYCWIKDGSEVELTSINKELYRIEVSSLIKGETKIDETFNDLPLGELLGKYKDGGVWYDDSKFTTPTKSETAMDKIMLVIYNKTIDDFKTGTLSLEELLDGIKLGELMGYSIGVKDGYCSEDCANAEEGHKHKYYWLKDGEDAKLSRLNESLYAIVVDDLIGGKTEMKDALNDLYIGDLLGKYYIDGEWFEDADGKTLVKNATAMDKIMKSIYGKTMDEMSNDSLKLEDMLKDVKLGELMSYTYSDGVWKDKDGVVVKFSKFDKTLYETDVEELVSGKDFKAILSGLYVGELMGNSYDKENDVWYDENENKKELDILEKTIYEVEVSDFLNNKVNFKQTMEHLYVGQLMGYSIGVKDGYCSEDCANVEEGHKHKYYWLKDGDEPVDNLNMIMADIQLAEIFNGTFNLKSKIDGVTLGDVITIEDDTPTILKLLKDEKISNMSTAINELKLGEVMGYTIGEKNGYCDANCTEDHDHNYYWLDGSAQVTGLNAKIANYTFNSFATDGFNASKFTLGDVITDPDEYGSKSIFSLLDVGEIDVDGDGEKDYDAISGSSDVEERKNIPVSQVSARVKSGVTKAKLGDLMNCGVFTLSDEEQSKLTDVFLVAGKGDWKSYTLQGFISTVIGMLKIN